MADNTKEREQLDMIAGQLFRLIKKYLDDAVAQINHGAVIKDVVAETEVSTGYFLTLTMANLIALCGLITNSSPVIIGAMLISPLMGPILSFGFAFITGARQIWRKSLRKIGISVILTLLVATVASFISPLKELTSEIISRTHPNLYDLIIAFLAGSAGAAALCTKKNYLTIVPGVAIATAVIPPLSVAGFGLGIGDFSIFAGGFFLFFTNFVAITLATTGVFYFYGFRSRMLAESDGQGLKKRLIYLGTVLFVISIPLVYTLYSSIHEVRMRSEIGRQLRHELEQANRSRLTTFDFSRETNGLLVVNAVINVVDYLSEETVKQAEKELKEAIKIPVNLVVEQVKVQPGGLKPMISQSPAAALAERPPSDLIRAGREESLDAFRRVSSRIEKIIAPSTITEFTVGFTGRNSGVNIALAIKRDTPVSDEERQMLARIVAIELDLPVELTVETAPFVPPLIFQNGEVEISEVMKKDLQVLQDAFRRDTKLRLRLESMPESGLGRAKSRSLAQRRAESIGNYLTERIKIPKSLVETVISSNGSRVGKVLITVLPSSQGPAKGNNGKF